MRLARQDDLGTLFVVDDLAKPVDVMEEQVESLVGCQPPGEADRQMCGIEGAEGGFGEGDVLATSQPVDDDAAADHLNQLEAHVAARSPKVNVRNLVDVTPQTRVVGVALPVGTEELG